LEKPGSKKTIYILVFLVVLGYAANIYSGILRDYHKTIPLDAWGRYSFAISLTFTRMLGIKGYVVGEQVEDKLRSEGFTSDPNTLAKFGKQYPDAFRDSSFMNSTLHRMATTISGKGREGIPGCCGLRGTGGDDIGLADLVHLSFRLFGYNIQGFYLSLYLILAISIVITLVDNRGRHAPVLANLIFLVMLYYIQYASPLMINLDGIKSLTDPLESPINPRFIPIFGIPAFLYICSTALDYQRPWSLSRITFLIVQSSILYFVIHIRVTGAWMLIAIACMALVATIPFLARKFLKRHLTLPVKPWPLALALCTYLFLSGVVMISLSAAYRSGGYIGHHAFWHSIYYSLAYNPEFRDKYKDQHHGLVTGDDMPYAGIDYYLTKNKVELAPHMFRGDTVPQLTGPSRAMALKFSEIERQARNAFFDFLKDDPKFVLSTFFYYKMAIIWRDVYISLIAALTFAKWYVLVAIAAAIAVGGGILAADREERRRFNLLSLATAVGTFAAFAASWLTVVGMNVMSDQLMLAAMLGAFCLTGIAAQLAALAMRIRS